jgi:RimJ/RimL family protein N-acetyltransferase
VTELSSSEREFASLLGELHALEEDIAAARATVARAQGGLDLLSPPESPLPAPTGEAVRLPDGAEVVVRALEPEDAPALELGLEHLSALSRYRRYRSAVKRVGAGELEALTHVDHRSRESLGAFDPSSGEAIGVARFVRDPRDPAQAELTDVVTDPWQHRGVGEALLERLTARARAVGIERVTATMLVGNERARGLLDHVAEPISEQREGGIVDVTAHLRDG